MNDDHLVSVAQLTEFAKWNNGAKFKSNSSKKETYEWIGRTIGKFKYRSLKKKEKSIVKRYIINMTGYSEGAVDKFIRIKKEVGALKPKDERSQNSFSAVYTPSDIGLLAEVSNYTLGQNGKAIKEMCKSMYDDYHDVRFERLASISVSHLYNLKKSEVYKTKALVYTKTNPVQRDIGVRKKPEPNGKPGYLRVDSVHQGDKDKEKGVYHINFVDEVTQGEHLGCVEGISEQFLLPLLEELLNAFPFKILGFHSDNGSEYINHQVAVMLNKMLIEQTKSRSRHSNDNALAESKNGAIVRKYMGHTHIPGRHAEKINIFYREYLNPYLNFHRYSGFATLEIDGRGKEKKKYDIYLTPIQKLLSLPFCEKYLKEGITKETLLTEMNNTNHFDAAKKVYEERQKLFKEINQKA